MKLSENFTLAELTATNTGLLNVPTPVQIALLRDLVVNVLQPLRELYGKPIRINSGFRSKRVNDKVGSNNRSQHLLGMAADLDSDNNALLFRLIRDNFKFDQLIWEGGDDKQPAWVHVSFRKGNNRQQVLRMKNGKYYKL